MKVIPVIAAKEGIPGCYGHASVFKHGSAICKACPGFEDCEVEVRSKLEAFSKKVDVSDHLMRHENGNVQAGILHSAKPQAAEIDVNSIPKRHQPVARVKKILTPDEDKFVSSLPVKVQVEAKRLINAGLLSVIKTKLQAGENPFPPGGTKFLYTACDELLKGGFTKLSLREAYMSRLGWSKATSFSHVSMLLSLFVGLGAIVETKEGFKINKENV